MATRTPFRVKATTSTTGTGTYTLTETGAAGYRTPTQAVTDGDLANGDEVDYIVVDTTVTNSPKLFEVGRGVWDNTAKTLTRAQVYQPAAGAVNWGAGTRDVLFVSIPSRYALTTNNLSDLASASTARTNLGLGSLATVDSPVPVANGGTGQTTALIPAGTKMLFFQAAAPTGWTQDASQNDKVIRVVSGAGGGTGGSWTITGLTASGTALTAAQLPNSGNVGLFYITTRLINSAVMGSTDFSETVVTSADSSFAGGDTSVNTLAAGSGNTHTHTISAGSSWRPSYVDCIVATKD